MTKLQVTSQIELDFEQVLEGIAHLDLLALDEFTDKVIALRAKRQATSLSLTESELLQKINHGLPLSLRLRFRALRQKLQENSITESEYEEYLSLADQIELADAERINHLAKLAALRNISIAQLVTQLDIQQPDNE